MKIEYAVCVRAMERRNEIGMASIDRVFVLSQMFIRGQLQRSDWSVVRLVRCPNPTYTRISSAITLTVYVALSSFHRMEPPMSANVTYCARAYFYLGCCREATRTVRSWFGIRSLLALRYLLRCWPMFDQHTISQQYGRHKGTVGQVGLLPEHFSKLNFDIYTRIKLVSLF